MSHSMTELHDFRTADQDVLPAAPPLLDSMPYMTYEMHSYEAPFQSAMAGESTYSYAAIQDYQIHHHQASSKPLQSRQCDEASQISTTATIEPFHLNSFPQGRPRTAFEDSRRTCQLLDVGHYCLDSDPTPLAAYHPLDDGFNALDQQPFLSTSTFPRSQHSIYQNPYSDSVTPPSGCRSPVAAWLAVPQNTFESLPGGEDGAVAREDLEEDDGSSDKPYARLIWEALMQAPGHRMMLREIYAWFQRYTNKARESGSNGWQNSIRHNLSMNQAFENDKSESSTLRGQAKKANSVWVLTENAIRDGVQSTTRYRKTGSGKKTHTSRTPAPLRQRSGAKGGRAARRAAKLRRNEQDRFSEILSFPGIPSPPDSYGGIGMDGAANDTDFISIHTPTTPTNDLSYSFSASLPIPNYPTDVPLFYTGDEEYLENGAPVQHELVMQPQKDPCFAGTEHFAYGSNPQQISM